MNPRDEWKWIKKCRSLLVWCLGQKNYLRARDHLREQLVLAFWMLCWQAILHVIDRIAGNHMLGGVSMSTALHLLEDISLLVWVTIFVAKAVRKEWRDHHD